MFVRKLLESILAVLSLSQRNHDRGALMPDLIEFRKAKDEFFATNHQSPLKCQFHMTKNVDRSMFVCSQYTLCYFRLSSCLR